MVDAIFNAAMAAYVASAILTMVLHWRGRGQPLAGLTLTVTGAGLGFVAAVMALRSGVTKWSLGSGSPLFSYSFRLDALSAFLVFTLSILAIAVSVYSIGYLHAASAKRQARIIVLVDALLLSLMVVFTAANAYLFMIAWEAMALSAYGLVSLEHESEECRNAGFLYLIMSHADAGFLLLGFSLLGHSAASLDFEDLHAAGSSLSPEAQSLSFWLFLVGFGIKAGVIPVHIWLPAAHPVAPSNASALLSGIVIKTGIYGMARVFFDFLGAMPAWTGTVLLTVAATSAILGVLYALMEHDLKRLLAYHSIENIGIILLGIGAALMFRASGEISLAALALTAGLFHTLNHAVFKCLLFLGAGAVQYSIHSRNMEQLGGLIRPMPVTALCFLTGAIAISGLPPLNGFVSEWLTYQSLLAGFGTTHTLMDLLFPVTGSLLALTGALAAACFVKAFGITFLGLPRSDMARQASEVPASMRSGMLILAAACVVLGVGASAFLPALDGLTQQVLGASRPPAEAGFTIVTAGALRRGSMSPLGIAAFLAVFGIAGFALSKLARMKNSTATPWDCGLPALGAQHEFTATAFSKPIRMVFSALFQPKREIRSLFDVSPYYPKAVHFESEIEQPFEDRLYLPFKRAVIWVSGRMRAVQAGSVHLYLAYVFVTLIALLVFTLRHR